MFKKITWLNRILSNPNKFILKDADNNVKTYEIQEDLSNVTQEGTIVSAENMNRIEDGIAECQSGYISIADTSTYASFDTSMHSGAITIAGDYSSVLKAGMQIKLTQNSTEKMFYVKDSITYSNNVTSVPIWSANSSVALENSTITNVKFTPIVQDVILCDW